MFFQEFIMKNIVTQWKFNSIWMVYDKKYDTGIVDKTQFNKLLSSFVRVVIGNQYPARIEQAKENKPEPFKNAFPITAPFALLLGIVLLCFLQYTSENWFEKWNLLLFVQFCFHVNRFWIINFFRDSSRVRFWKDTYIFGSHALILYFSFRR